MSETNGTDADKFEAVTRRLKRLAQINVERMVRSRHDVDLMSQMRYEMLLLKAQMDTTLVVLGEHVIAKDEFAKRHYDYLHELVATLQTALKVQVLNDGSVLRL